MRLTIDERPGLSVAWAEQDRKTVQRELTRLHPALYLHRSQDGVWSVRDRDGGDVTVLEWPHPLSHAIVDAVKRQEKRSKEDLILPSAMAAENEYRRKKAHERAVDDMEQIYRVHRPIFSRKQVRITTPLERR